VVLPALPSHGRGFPNRHNDSSASFNLPAGADFQISSRGSPPDIDVDLDSDRRFRSQPTASSDGESRPEQ
jgi:hypothetical protein